MARARSKKKRRLKILTTALLHMVACPSNEKYCSGCDLAEQVLRQDKRIDALLCQGVL